MDYVAIPELLLLLWPWGHWSFLIVGLISIPVSSLFTVLGIWEMAIHFTSLLGKTWFFSWSLEPSAQVIPQWFYTVLRWRKLVNVHGRCPLVPSGLSWAQVALHLAIPDSPHLFSACSFMRPQSIWTPVVSFFFSSSFTSLFSRDDTFLHFLGRTVPSFWTISFFDNIKISLNYS